ncbi:MAG: valine--tRNA ligase, partial [Verrucomicrobiae bacterium]|nr:valine--tRNA ligase [Verrucomicrobiae bacterium]
PANKRIKFILSPARELSSHDVAVMALLLNAERLDVIPGFVPAQKMPAVPTGLGDLYMPLEGAVDVAAEKARLGKELQKINAELARLEQKLSDPEFTQKAPAQVLQDHRQRLTELQTARDKMQSTLESLA